MTPDEEGKLFLRQIQALESIARDLDLIVQTVHHLYPSPMVNRENLKPAPPEALTRTPLSRLKQWEEDESLARNPIR